jgi:hypothetical protein
LLIIRNGLWRGQCREAKRWKLYQSSNNNNGHDNWSSYINPACYSVCMVKLDISNKNICWDRAKSTSFYWAIANDLFEQEFSMFLLLLGHSPNSIYKTLLYLSHFVSFFWVNYVHLECGLAHFENCRIDWSFSVIINSTPRVIFLLISFYSFFMMFSLSF